ncbi:MAG TPA: IS5 family transposase [bacterium]|nr:IS5 family transposase [bacterium]
MTTRHRSKRRLRTIWRIPDDLWAQLKPLLPPEKSPGTNGRPVVPFRQVMDGILYVLRTGCQWKALPREYGSGSTCHRRFQAWVEAGIFERLWAKLLTRYDELRGIQWRWQSLDSAMVKAPLGGRKTGPNPTDRGKLGTKRHTLTDQRGTPLAVVVTGANCHDMKAATTTLDSVAVRRPRPTLEEPQHLCLDKGYDYPEIEAAVRKRQYTPHLRHRGECPPRRRRHPARRWVVERTGAWHNRFRKLLIRFEKRMENYRGLVHFACALIVYRLTVL